MMKDNVNQQFKIWLEYFKMNRFIFDEIVNMFVPL